MKHVKFLLPALIIFSLFACDNATKKENQEETSLTTTIQGEIINPKETPLLLKIGVKTDTIRVDENNQFTWTADLTESEYLQFAYRRNGFTLYVQAGDTLNIGFDADNKENPITYNKCESPASEYLMKMHAMQSEKPALRDLLYETDIDAFLNEINEKETAMQALLDSYAEQINDKEFIALEEKRIAYLFYNLKFQYRDYFLYFTEREGALDSVSFFSFANALDIEDETSLKLDSYVEAIQHLVMHGLKSNGIDDFPYERQVIEQLKETRNLLDNQAIEEAVVFNILMDYARYNGFDAVDEDYQNFIEHAKHEDRIDIIQALYNTWEPLQSGKPAPDFTFPDENGEMISLRDFRGKVVYIDVWATWCGPCRAEAPQFDRLEMEYRDENIAFLSVSVDDKKESWMKFLEEEEPEWTQLYTGGWECSICDDYFIKGIPRFILIDKDGNIVDATAPRPSSNEIRPLLDEVIGIEM